MKIISTPLELKTHLRSIDKPIGFVPTMGALHEGHISLIKEAKKSNAFVVVSIFVNPTQFAKGEDLSKYPSDELRDKKICEMSGVDVLFYPQVEDIYGEDEVSLLAPKIRGYILEGFTRPSHFNGVLSVVVKLLNIVNPTKAYFGKKDAQQLMLIELMVKQLFMDVEIVAVDTVRENDGLAMSSRNIYLSTDEREKALSISRSLNLASSMITRGILDVATITEAMREFLAPLEVYYVEVLSRKFEKIPQVIIGQSIILVEVKVGTTRLLDNIWL